MATTYIVASVEGQKTWEGNHGPMVDYTLSVTGESGTPHRNVVLTQKPVTAVPMVGQQITGTLEQGKYGTKLKKEPPPQQGGGSTWKPRDPAETAAIQRQASQRTAATLLAPLLNGVDPLTATPEFWERLWKLVDRATDRLELGIQTHAQPYGEAKPERRKDSERTGVSDVPSPAEGEFVAPPAQENEMWSAA